MCVAICDGTWGQHQSAACAAREALRLAVDACACSLSQSLYRASGREASERPRFNVDPSADHLKLCDFSLSHRLVVPVDAQTRRVASLWYRSPEILLGGPPSAFPLDMWSVGCLNAEMLAHCPLFPGGSEIETLFLQFGRLGTPTEETWPGVSSLPYWSDKFPMFPARPNLSSVAGGDASTAHFLAQLLCCDPAKRIGADASLGHKYFGDLDRTGHGADYASRYRKDGARAGSPEESLCAPLPDTVTEAEDMLRKKRARH